MRMRCPTELLLRRNGILITWDSLSNDELIRIKEYIESYHIIYGWSGRYITNDGKFNTSALDMERHLNKEYVIREGEPYTFQLVTQRIAKEIYKEANLSQPPRTAVRQPRFINVYSQDEVPEGYPKPPIELESKYNDVKLIYDEALINNGWNGYKYVRDILECLVEEKFGKKELRHISFRNNPTTYVTIRTPVKEYLTGKLIVYKGDNQGIPMIYLYIK